MDQLIDDLLQVYEDRRTEAEMFVAQVRTFFSKSPDVTIAAAVVL